MELLVGFDPHAVLHSEITSERTWESLCGVRYQVCVGHMRGKYYCILLYTLLACIVPVETKLSFTKF